MMYANVRISRLPTLHKFSATLHSADQKWDSLRRIPYSCPGRWVKHLDLSLLAVETRAQALQIDTILTNLFPLTPFLSSFYFTPAYFCSRRMLLSLAERPGAASLRKVRGLGYATPLSPHPQDDPFVRLLQSCPYLEEVEVVGQGLEHVDQDLPLHPAVLPPIDHFPILHLPNLRVLALISMPASPLMQALLFSDLPALRKVTLTPYDDLPFPHALGSALIAAHGAALRSLLLYTPKAWPTRLRPSPDNILAVAPHLRHLSLEAPLPHLEVREPHQCLQILSVPRLDESWWPVLYRLIESLPHLAVLRVRDVKWLRKGLSSMALDTGIQGQMRDWNKRLARNGVRVLDQEWREEPM